MPLSSALPVPTWHPGSAGAGTRRDWPEGTPGWGTTPRRWPRSLLSAPAPRECRKYIKLHSKKMSLEIISGWGPSCLRPHTHATSPPQVSCHERPAEQTFLNLHFVWIFTEKALFWGVGGTAKSSYLDSMPNHSSSKLLKSHQEAHSSIYSFHTHLLRGDWICSWSGWKRPQTSCVPCPRLPDRAAISSARPGTGQNLTQSYVPFHFKNETLQDEGTFVLYHDL